MHITFYPTRLFQRHHPPPSSFLPIRQSGDRTRRTFPSTSHPVRIFPKRFYEKLNIIAPHKNELTRLLLFEHLSHDNFSISIVDGYCESWPPEYAPTAVAATATTAVANGEHSKQVQEQIWEMWGYALRESMGCQRVLRTKKEGSERKCWKRKSIARGRKEQSKHKHVRLVSATAQ